MDKLGFWDTTPGKFWEIRPRPILFLRKPLIFSYYTFFQYFLKPQKVKFLNKLFLIKI
jgi:hypothetical protein